MLNSSSLSSSSSSKSGALLAPGFRFHPTDEELVSYYLKRKICGKPLRFDAISEVDIYKSEPWDLPSQSRLKTRDLEWYFFSSLDKKHGNGSRTNRATERGYWKTTGKDRPVRRNSGTVGMKKTLVFHVGRAPHGERTNWVMHEYRLEYPELGQAGIAQGAFVLCRIFQKSGSGPKNGEQYGAPLVEEEWDDDLVIPKKVNSGVGNTDTVCHVDECGYIQMNDSEQNLDATSIQYDNVVPLLGFHGYDGDNNLKDQVRFPEGVDDQKFLNCTCEDANFPELCAEEFFNGMGENSNLPEEHADKYFCSVDENANLTESDRMCPLVKVENYVELIDVNSVGVHNLTGEIGDDGLMYFDAPAHNGPRIEDEFFIEMDDLLNCDEADASGFEMLDEYLTYFDATNDNLLHIPQDSSPNLSERVDYISNPLIPGSEVNVGTVQTTVECPQALKLPDVEHASSSLQKAEASTRSRGNSTDDFAANDTLQPDVPSEATWDKSLAKHFSSMLESITAPPAFAVDYATKGSAKSIGHNSAQSTSVHVNAGMFLVSDLRVTEGGKHWLSQKAGDVGFLQSYGMGGDVMASKQANSHSYVFEIITETPASAISVIWQAGLYLGFLWVLVLAFSYKISNYICTR